MFRFFESIALIDGIPRNLDYHQDRVDRTFANYYPSHVPINLYKIVFDKGDVKIGKQKLKVIYNETDHQTCVSSYFSRKFSKHYIVEADDFSYSFKEVNRDFFELHSMVKNQHAIFSQGGFLVDGIYSNLIFFDQRQWLTPHTYLLNGTMRQSLLDQGKICEDEIRVVDLKRFSKFKLINALNSFEEACEYPISAIKNIR